METLIVCIVSCTCRKSQSHLVAFLARSYLRILCGTLIRPFSFEKGFASPRLLLQVFSPRSATLDIAGQFSLPLCGPSVVSVQPRETRASIRCFLAKPIAPRNWLVKGRKLMYATGGVRDLDRKRSGHSRTPT